MQISFSSPTIPEEARRVIEALDALDLSKVKSKLIYSEDGAQWTPELADQVEAEYRRFLMLIFLAHGRPIVPSKILDRFWHQHILDTMSYARDCQQLFGFFLHHNPYFGMGGEQEHEALMLASEYTKSLWLATFGETPQIDALCNGGACSWLIAPSTCSDCPAPSNCVSMCNSVDHSAA